MGLLKKIKIETAVNEDFVELAIKALEAFCHTGHAGNGIFAIHMGECVQIGTGERGHATIG